MGAVIGGLLCKCLPVIIVACVSCIVCCGRKNRRHQPTIQQVTGGGTYTPPTVGNMEVNPAAAAYPSVPYRNPPPPEYAGQPSSAPYPNDDAASCQVLLLILQVIMNL